jgi:glycosyltransferase involved in cell wall biosynthesis
MANPLKLALVTRRYPPLIGGAEKVLSYLAKAFAAEGAKVTVVTSQVPGSLLPDREDVAVETVQQLSSASIPERGRLSIVRLATSSLRFWGTLQYMRNLERWFDRNPIDVAYVSMLKHDAYVVTRAGRRKGFPVVLRPEGAGPTGDIAWQSWGNFGRAIGLTCRRADAFVCISRSVEEELQQSLRIGTMKPSQAARIANRQLEAPRMISIPNGVPIPASPWQARPGWNAAPRAIFVGRLAPEKGLDTLIAAWPQVTSRFPNAHLVLAGEGRELAALDNQALTLGLTVGPGQSVEFAGLVAEPTLALGQADLFVLPSREEGMSIALLEAMALGIPIVASLIPGNQRLIDDRVHGRLVPPNDPAALARTIIEQCEGPAHAAEMGLAARSRVEREFSIQAVARRHLALFHELSQTRRAYQ